VIWKRKKQYLTSPFFSPFIYCSWYGEQVPNMGACPAVYINTLMGNWLERNACSISFFLKNK